MTSSDDAIVIVGRRNGATRAARALGLRVIRVDPDEDIGSAARMTAQAKPVAVIAVTERAVVAAARLREALGLPGISVETAIRCTDKAAMKATISAAGLRCAAFVEVGETPDAESLAIRPGFPLVLKTRVGSGGRGALFIRTADQLPRAVVRPSLAERFVDGIEMSVESFVVDGEPIWVNGTDYVEPRWANLVPAALDATTYESVLALNRRAIAAIGVTRGMTHLEVFLTAEGPCFGELAARPPGGHLMRLIELAYDFDPWVAMLACEIGRVPQVRHDALHSAGVRFFHPGPGVVASVTGVAGLRNLPGLVELDCQVKPGDSIHPREGAGQHYGFALFAGEGATVSAGLQRVKTHLRIDMTPSEQVGGQR